MVMSDLNQATAVNQITGDNSALLTTLLSEAIIPDVDVPNAVDDVIVFVMQENSGLYAS